MRFVIGSQARLTVAFTVSGAPADPTIITVKIRTPAGVETSHVYGTDPDVKRSGAGSYYYDLYCAEDGTYHHRWTGAGALVAAAETRHNVDPTAFDTP